MGGRTTVVRSDSFRGVRVAVGRGNRLYHLHGDHLGSASLTTAGSTVEASRAYYAYGSERAATGDLRIDRTFTGQKADGTGLLYYNARYYDPSLGTFIAPDSMVPNPARVIDYNRVLYARGNPLKYSDPSGHATWEEMNNWYNARGWFHDSNKRDWSIKGNPTISSRQSAIQALTDAGIEIENKANHTLWPRDRLKQLASGIAKFGERLEDLQGVKTGGGIDYLNSMIQGDITWRRKATAADSDRPDRCDHRNPAACAWPDGSVEWYDKFLAYNATQVMAFSIHEMAHKIHFDPSSTKGCKQDTARCASIFQTGNWFLLTGNVLTQYAATWYVEYWAEAVGVWVFENDYPDLLVDIETVTYRNAVFNWVEEILKP